MRAIAIMPPGMFLSQPPTTNAPSIAWPLTLVSIASAITSRDTSEYFIASVPMPMPSVTVGTPKTWGLAPACASACIARSTSGWIPALQGFIVEWPLATPTIGLSKSPSPKPTARSMARLGERATPWVIRRERRFGGVAGFFCGMGSSSEGAIVRLAASPCQCNFGLSVILFRYGFAGIVAPQVFQRGRGAAALRPRRGCAAYLAAALVARDPRARGAARGRALHAQPASRRAHAGGRAPARGKPPHPRAARAQHARAARHGERRAWQAAHRLRLARRLRRATRPAESVQSDASARAARAARNALAGAVGGARRRRARLRPAAAAGRRRRSARAHRGATRTLRRRAAR